MRTGRVWADARQTESSALNAKRMRMRAPRHSAARDSVTRLILGVCEWASGRRYSSSRFWHSSDNSCGHVRPRKQTSDQWPSPAFPHWAKCRQFDHSVKRLAVEMGSGDYGNAFLGYFLNHLLPLWNIGLLFTCRRRLFVKKSGNSAQDCCLWQLKAEVEKEIYFPVKSINKIIFVGLW